MNIKISLEDPDGKVYGSLFLLNLNKSYEEVKKIAYFVAMEYIWEESRTRSTCEYIFCSISQALGYEECYIEPIKDDSLPVNLARKGIEFPAIIFTNKGEKKLFSKIEQDISGTFRKLAIINSEDFDG